LTRDRLLYSHAGRGTFISDRKIIEQPLQHLTAEVGLS